MKQYYYARVYMSSREVGYEDMLSRCEIVDLQRPAKAGEVIDDMFIPSDDSPFTRDIINNFEEKTFVRAIPLRYISLCTSPFDLSEYGFEAICDEDGCTKWCNFSRLPRSFVSFERILQKIEEENYDRNRKMCI